MRFLIAMGMGVLAVACGSGNATLGNDNPDPNEIRDGSSADGGKDVVTTDDGGETPIDGGDPLYPPGRLFVSMEGSALAVWDNARSITADVPPTFTLGDSSVASGTLGLVLAKKRLFVGTKQATGTVLAFDGADTLKGSALPAAKIPSSQLVPSPTDWKFWSPSRMTWDAKSDSLWVGGGMGIEHFSGASTLGSSSSGKAFFSHPWFQLPGAAYDPTGDRLFLGQISGAGLLAFDSASSASGTPTSNFVLLPSKPAWAMTIDGDRLYAMIPGGGSTTAATLLVWKGISGVSAAKAPDVTMGGLSGLYGFSGYVGVDSNVLIAVMQSGKIHLWTNASSLNGETMPTQTITVDRRVGNEPMKAVLGPVSGRLYVMDNESVSIYANPTTAPKLVAKIKSGITKPVDFAVLE